MARRLSVLVLAAAGACARSQLPPDVALIEAGDARIARIDGYPIQAGGGTFKVRPGGHTVDISAVWVRPDFGLIPVEVKLVGRLCVKARAGRRYRIKQAFSEGRNRVYFIDTATGEAPKTPCGPDEDDD